MHLILCLGSLHLNYLYLINSLKTGQASYIAIFVTV